MSQVVLLDNEAVQALEDPMHPKHRRVVAQAQVVAQRKRRAASIEVVVPTAVRVEAGWDRTASAWAFPNRLRITDVPLDAVHANIAAAIRNRTGVSVTDAHLGAVIESAPADRITVVTSDPDDMRLVAGQRQIILVSI
jgi:predicted nucleic acid-binding protein